MKKFKLFFAAIFIAFAANAQSTHTWNSEMPITQQAAHNGVPITVTNGSTVEIRAGAAGRLVIPENATVTIVSNGAVENNVPNRRLDFELHRGSRVVWTANYSSGEIMAITLTHMDVAHPNTSVFEIAGGAIINSLGIGAVAIATTPLYPPMAANQIVPVVVSGNTTLRGNIQASMTINSGVSVTVPAGGVLTNQAGRTLNNNGTINGNVVNSGTLNNNGTINGNVTLQAGSTINGNAPTGTVTGTGENNTGPRTHNWNSATPPTGVLDGEIVIIAAGARGTLTIPANATVTITSNGQVLNNANSAVIIDFNAGSAVIWNADYTHTGSASVALRHLDVASAGTSIFYLAGGAIINDRRAELAMQTTSAGNLQNVAVVVTGNVSMQGIIDITNFTVNQGAVLTVTGTNGIIEFRTGRVLTNNGTINGNIWNSGTINNNGRINGNITQGTGGILNGNAPIGTVTGGTNNTPTTRFVDITGKNASDIQADIRTAIQQIPVRGVVMVIGTASIGDNMVDFNIPTNRTVVWDATIDGTFVGWLDWGMRWGGLICVGGDGVFTVTGSIVNNGLAAALQPRIPGWANPVTYNIAGGTVRNTGAGVALLSSGSPDQTINIINGGVLRANTGFAISINGGNTFPLNITDGIVFANRTDPVQFVTSEVVIGERGVIVGWQSETTPREYHNLSTARLTANPARNAHWCHAAQGIANNRNNIVIQIPGVSVSPNLTPLTISGLTANDKTYDGTAAATMTGTATLVRTNVATNNTVNLTGTPVFTFADANAGNNIAVNISGLSLTGADAHRYTLVIPELTANITPAPLTITGFDISKKHDGNTDFTGSLGNLVLAGLMGDETATVDFSQVTATFESANAGTEIPISFEGEFGVNFGTANPNNYTLMQPTGITGSILAGLFVNGVFAERTQIPAAITAELNAGRDAVITGTLVIPDGEFLRVTGNHINSIVWNADLEGNRLNVGIFDIFEGKLHIIGGTIHNRGGNGRRVVSRNNARVLVTGGTLTRGWSLEANNTSVIYYTTNTVLTDTRTIGNISFVIRNTSTNTTHFAGTSTGLVLGAETTNATVTWAIQGGKSGISFSRNTNSGFMEIPGITVTVCECENTLCGSKCELCGLNEKPGVCENTACGSVCEVCGGNEKPEICANTACGSVCEVCGGNEIPACANTLCESTCGVCGGNEISACENTACGSTCGVCGGNEIPACTNTDCGSVCNICGGNEIPACGICCDCKACTSTENRINLADIRGSGRAEYLRWVSGVDWQPTDRANAIRIRITGTEPVTLFGNNGDIPVSITQATHITLEDNTSITGRTLSSSLEFEGQTALTIHGKGSGITISNTATNAIALPHLALTLSGEFGSIHSNVGWGIAMDHRGSININATGTFIGINGAFTIAPNIRLTEPFLVTFSTNSNGTDAQTSFNSYEWSSTHCFVKIELYECAKANIACGSVCSICGGNEISACANTDCGSVCNICGGNEIPACGICCDCKACTSTENRIDLGDARGSTRAQYLRWVASTLSWEISDRANATFMQITGSEPVTLFGDNRDLQIRISDAAHITIEDNSTIISTQPLRAALILEARNVTIHGEGNGITIEAGRTISVPDNSNIRFTGEFGSISNNSTAEYFLLPVRISGTINIDAFATFSSNAGLFLIAPSITLDKPFMATFSTNMDGSNAQTSFNSYEWSVEHRFLKIEAICPVCEFTAEDCICVELCALCLDEICVCDDTTTGNPDWQLNLLRTWTQNGQLYIGGLILGETLNIYNASGVLVQSITVSNTQEILRLPARGVYIIITGNRTARVVF